MKKQREININWDKLGFEVLETKSMFRAIYPKEGQWSSGELIPYGPIELSPAAGVLNYGQGVFEGMKALRSSKGNVVLFRPDMNAKRIIRSSRRLCIPEIDKYFFKNSVVKTVIDNLDYLPPFGRGSLYIRPILWGTEPVLGVRPVNEYTFIIFASPVGSYFKNGVKPLNLIINSDYHRAAPKGTGNAKAIGNYSASLYPLIEAKKQGFDEVIYLNAKHESRIEEAGSANIFIIKDNIVKTPYLDGSILPGVTRDSAIIVAKEILNLDVLETEITIDEILYADEVFCTGTAVVVNPVGSITYQEEKLIIGDGEIGDWTSKVRDTLVGIQLQEIDDPFGWVITISE
tara:strand:- start:502 stop:1536 length:1035 start_codon:yes stop_codon:yes gene_type:complete